MNKYILMSMGISGMGGGQMYLRNKLLYMEQKGWKVDIYSGLPGKVVIPELMKYSLNINPVLTSAPFVYSNGFVDSYVDKIIKNCCISSNDIVIIESTTAHMSYWGEIIAKRCNGRHICYLLDERNDYLVYKRYLPFFYYKLQRNELAGINSKSLMYLFRGYKNCCIDGGPFLPALCQNVVEDIEIPKRLKLPIADYTIGSIGRLEKPYIPYLIREIVKYVNRHQKKQYNLLLIGGTNDNKRILEIKKGTENIKNLNVIITGYMFPIPKQLILKVDLFISSAGSAGVSYGLDRPTISLDAFDCKPIGLLGYTTKHSLYRGEEKVIELSKWIENVLDKKIIMDLSYTPKGNNSFELFEKHSQFLKRCKNKMEYYDIMKIHPQKKDFLKKIIIRLCGDKCFLKIKILFCKIRNQSYE